MIGKNFTLLFYLKKRGNYVSGKLPIYMRVSVNGRRSEMSVGRECDPEMWNNSAARMTGMKADAKQLNGFLDLIQAKVYEAYRQMIDRGLEISSENIRNTLTGVYGKPRTIWMFSKIIMKNSKS